MSLSGGFQKRLTETAIHATTFGLLLRFAGMAILQFVAMILVGRKFWEITVVHHCNKSGQVGTSVKLEKVT